MRFKGIVVGLLTAILAVNAIVAVLLVVEAKKQTSIILTQASITVWKEAYEQKRIDYTTWVLITQDAADKLTTIRNEPD